jgi:hypothetical protein
MKRAGGGQARPSKPRGERADTRTSPARAAPCTAAFAAFQGPDGFSLIVERPTLPEAHRALLAATMRDPFARTLLGRFLTFVPEWPQLSDLP